MGEPYRRNYTIFLKTDEATKLLCRQTDICLPNSGNSLYREDHSTQTQIYKYIYLYICVWYICGTAPNNLIVIVSQNY